MHIPKGRRIFFFQKTLLYIMLFFLIAFWCFELCLVSSMLCCSHRIMLLSQYYCVLLVACSDDHCSHFHMTVYYMIKLLTCFASCLLDRILLVTLYLFFYHLIYLEGLMCFVQVFQVTGIHVPSSSQLLDLGVSEFCHCSQTHVYVQSPLQGILSRNSQRGKL